ncbi:MAG: ATP-binding cassette domain-containing protein, partial [Syntrophales bacterium]|nr:ATP-binding cassette domain-containing protein [Syntrophales bacterium]
MIEMQNVRKGFNMGQTNEFVAVHGVSVTIEKNMITVLKGPSGSGKTTLLSLMGCMARPTSGRIKLRQEKLGGNGFPVIDGMAEAEVTSLPEQFLTDIRR